MNTSPKLPLPLLLAIGATTLLIAAVPIANRILDRLEQPILYGDVKIFPPVIPAHRAYRPDRLQDIARSATLGTQGHSPDAARRVLQQQIKQVLGKQQQYQPPRAPSEASSWSVEGYLSIQGYLAAQVRRRDDNINPPPPGLRNYLADTRVTRAAIHAALLRQPQGTKLLDDTSIQELLLVDALEQRRLGKTSAALELLEVSWTLTQLRRDRDLNDRNPYLRQRLVQNVQDIDRLQMGVLRKLGAVPLHWQQRLLEQDDRQLWLTAMNTTNTSDFEYTWLALNKASSQDFDGATSVWSSDGFLANDYQPNHTRYLQPMGFAGQPIARIQAVRQFQAQKSYLAAIAAAPACALPPLPQNPLSQTDQALEAINSTMRRATRHRLAAELTQYILHVKGIVASTGTLPQTVPDRPSVTCPGSHWAYRIIPNGRALLTLQQKPAWLLEELQAARSSNTTSNQLPLTYRIQSP